MLVARLEHRNLVRLLGFCYQGEERLLVYELVQNSSLDRYIFDPVKCRILNWEKHYRIITGIARGLVYLHEDSRLRIIHRDLKASNILLDEGLNPKIADFGSFRDGEGDSLLAYAWKNWNEGRATNVTCESLQDGSRAEMMRCIHIGILCVQENAVDRPDMGSVALMLGSHSMTLRVPSRPAFFMNTSQAQYSSSSGEFKP